MACRKPVLIVTTCASGKRISSDAIAATIATGSLDQVASRWSTRLARVTDLVPARDLYKGRAFAIARAAAGTVGADFGVLSAGLGYVRGDEWVPGYDLTLQTGKPGSIAARVTSRFSPPAWWHAVRGGRFASDLVADAKGYDLILVAISRSYLDMAVADLLAIEAAAPGRLRLFGRTLGPHVPEGLAAAVMPYDARLDGLGRQGTLTDFGARALEDFVLACDLAAERSAQTQCVARRLAAVPAPAARPPQRRVEDSEVRDAIRSFVAGGGRGSAKALSWLRRERGMSCEQSRFAKLFREETREKAR